MNLKRSAYRAAMLTTALVAVLGTGVGASFADTSGRHGIGSGNRLTVPVTAPVDVCGNGVGVLGRGRGVCPGGATASRPDIDRPGDRASGRRGILSGNRVSVPITAPVNVCGNGVGLLGRGLGLCEGGASVSGDDDDSNYYDTARRSGRRGGGLLSGNDVDVPVTAPVNVCGNAVGNALAACQGGATVTPDDEDSAYSSSSPMPDASRASGSNTTSNTGNTGSSTLPNLNLPLVGGLLQNGVGGLTGGLGGANLPALPSGLGS